MLDVDPSRCKLNASIFSFTTFLSDAHGGYEKSSGGSRVYKRQFPIGSEPDGKGIFHSTTFDGTRYPTIAYVYQEIQSRDWVCVATTGASDGQVRGLMPNQDAQPCVFPIAKAGVLPRAQSSELQISSVDINGNGKGGWFLSSCVNDLYSVCPVYNESETSDMLLSARDPIGMKTTLDYLPLSDPRVYRSGVSWDDLRELPNVEERAVIASQTMVVSRIDQSNDALINGLAWYSSISKGYSAAKIDYTGRGWLGFAHITSAERVSGKVTVETYDQAWPTSKLLRQTDIYGPKITVTSISAAVEANRSAFSQMEQSELAKREVLTYQVRSNDINKWRTYAVHEIDKETTIYDDGKQWPGTSGLEHGYTADGNLEYEASWQKNVLTGTREYQLWTRYSYTKIGNVIALPTRKKITTLAENKNMDSFEKGDVTLTRFTYEEDSPKVKLIEDWSSDHDTFVSKKFLHDEYNNQVEMLDAAGLKTSVTFDTSFPSFPVLSMQSSTDIGLATMSVYDVRHGTSIASYGADGAIKIVRLDGFGRTIESRAPVSEGGGTVGWTDEYTAHAPGMQKALTTVQTETQVKIDYQQHTTNSGLRLLIKESKSFADANGLITTTISEVLDCDERVRIRREANGNFEPVWTYFEYDHAGNTISRSMPTHLSTVGPNLDGFDWKPDPENTIRATFDVLDRPQLQYRPKSKATISATLTSTTYACGGCECTSLTRPCSAAGQVVTEELLAKTYHLFATIGGKAQLVRDSDNSNLTTKYGYDPAGRLTSLIDAAGNVETRTYNNAGQLLSIDNIYQNLLRDKQKPAVRFEYDLMGRMMKKTNAMEEVTTFQYDSKGRLTRRCGGDGRTTVREYDVPSVGLGRLASVNVSQPGSESPESTQQFRYDQRGNVIEGTLSVGSFTKLVTSYRYNLQNQMIEKTYPDLSVLHTKYSGKLLEQVKLTSPDGEG